MSWHLTGWLGEVGAQLDHAEFRVLFRLCHCCNQQTGLCIPSIPTIAKQSKMSRSTVKRALGSLEAGGWITRQHNFNDDGSQTTNSYHVNASTEYFYPDGSVKVGGSPVDRGGVTSEPEGGSPVDPKQRTLTGKNSPSHAHAKGLCPDDFFPDCKPGSLTYEKMQAWSPDELAEEIQHFIDYHQARDNKYHWQAAWRTWVSNHKKFNGGNTNGSGRTALPGMGGFGASSERNRTAEAAADALREIDACFQR